MSILYILFLLGAMYLSFKSMTMPTLGCLTLCLKFISLIIFIVAACELIDYMTADDLNNTYDMLIKETSYERLL